MGIWSSAHGAGIMGILHNTEASTGPNNISGTEENKRDGAGTYEGDLVKTSNKIVLVLNFSMSDHDRVSSVFHFSTFRGVLEKS